MGIGSSILVASGSYLNSAVTCFPFTTYLYSWNYAGNTSGYYYLIFQQDSSIYKFNLFIHLTEN